MSSFANLASRCSSGRSLNDREELCRSSLDAIVMITVRPISGSSPLTREQLLTAKSMISAWAVRSQNARLQIKRVSTESWFFQCTHARNQFRFRQTVQRRTPLMSAVAPITKSSHSFAVMKHICRAAKSIVGLQPINGGGGGASHAVKQCRNVR
jgi:hypothetical protein